MFYSWVGAKVTAGIYLTKAQFSCYEAPSSHFYIKSSRGSIEPVAAGTRDDFARVTAYILKGVYLPRQKAALKLPESA